MNILTDFEAHKRDEDFSREDAKHRAPVTHAQRVAFADALMAPPTREIECPGCGDARIVKVIDDCGCFEGTALCGRCGGKS